jgi:hypothetical protein
MKQTETKALYITMEYTDQAEALRILESIISDIKGKTRNHNRMLHNGVLFEWGISKPYSFESYRCEIINGQRCIVIPSKMNSDES